MADGTKVVTLCEYEAIDLRLGAADIEFLAAHRTYFDLRCQGKSVWRVRARSWAGSLALPSLTIRVLPKCGMTNLLRMISEVYEIGRIEPAEVSRGSHDEPSTLLVAVFARRLLDLIRRGVRRDYVEQRRRLTSPRGRLIPQDDVHRPGLATRGLSCRFEEYSADIYDNRVIRRALHCVPPTGMAPLDGTVRRLRRTFGAVTNQQIDPQRLAQRRYNRLNRHYQPIHGLCRLILEGRGLGQSTGEHRGPSLLVDMSRLFEQFVARRIIAELPANTRAHQHPRLSVDVEGQITILPDLTISQGQRPRLVVDMKYKLHKGLPRTSDAYQVLAYARTLGVRHGVLLYPDIRTQRIYRTHDGENAIIVDGVDLSRAWPQVEADIAALISRLAALSVPEPVDNTGG